MRDKCLDALGIELDMTTGYDYSSTSYLPQPSLVDRLIALEKRVAELEDKKK